MESLLVYYLIIWEPLGYLLSFFGVMIEGDITLFTLVFLSSQGFFNLGLILLAAFLGAILSDSVIFWFGLHAHRLPPRLLAWVTKIASPFDQQIRTRPYQTLFLCKLTYGVQKPALARMAMLGVPYKKFLTKDLTAIGLWLVVVSSLSYFSGLSYFLVRQYLRFAEVGILIGLVFFFVISKLISHYYSIKKL